MTPLTQQLEDKKKGCGCSLRIVDLGLGEELFACNKNDLCKTCKSNIAILKQAIAEMQKQRQEILDWIKEHEFTQNQGGYLIYADDLEAYIQEQLNQPKEEGKE